MSSVLPLSGGHLQSTIFGLFLLLHRTWYITLLMSIYLIILPRPSGMFDALLMQQVLIPKSLDLRAPTEAEMVTAEL